MRVVFLGATKFSEEMLFVLLENRISVEAIFSIPKEFQIKKRGSNQPEKYENSNYSNMEIIASKAKIPFYLVSGGDQSISSYHDVIASLQPDIILVLGWYFLVPKSIRDLSKIGTFGIHASLLPEYAGGSPLVWALINGEKKTGITMFKIEEGIDDGDILAQKEIEIDFCDTIGSLYSKVTEASKKMLFWELQKLSLNQASFVKQDKERIKPLPIRKEEDGLIDWSKSDIEIYNFIRAQTKPYPCAFSFFNSEKIKFLAVSLVTIKEKYAEYKNGSVIFNNGDFFIKVGNTVIKPLEIEVRGKIIPFNKYFGNKNIVENIFSNRN